MFQGGPHLLCDDIGAVAGNPYRDLAALLTFYVIGCGVRAGEPIGAEVSPGISPPTEGLIGYWKLDEMAATDPVVDSSGNHHDGMSVNGPLPAAPSPAMSTPNLASRSFNGVDQYILIGNPPALNILGQITLAAWVNVSGLTTNCQVVISHGFRFHPDQEVALRLGGGQCGNTAGPDKWAAGSWDGGDHFAVTSFVPDDMGTWIHLAGTYDGTSWRLYRDGVEVSVTATTVGAISVDADWTIGGKAPGDPNYAERFLHGHIDDVRIYNRALTPSEVAELSHR